MAKISPHTRKQLDSLVATSAGKDLIAAYSDRLTELLLGVLQVETNRVDMIRGEARNMIFALKSLTGKNVVLKISFEE